MTIVLGQIESLVRIRETLDEKGITRFNSIGEIKTFINNYNNEIEEALFKIQNDVDLEIDDLLAEQHTLQKEYDTIQSNATTKWEARISKLNTRCNSLATKPTKNAYIETAIWYQLQFFKLIKFLLEKNFNRLVSWQTHKKGSILKTKINEIKAKMPNRQATISNRYTKKLNELEHMKEVAYSLNDLIAGAIGESLVEKELKKLPDTYVLFNDFSVKFNEPIYNKRENDRIYSIQIDHLLVSRAGIFIIETKNWSKASIERYDMRSPVSQIKRASFALFVILNSNNSAKSRFLNKHHWGDRKLKIRNLIVMINHKPKEEFKFVTVKALNELNDFINYFEPIYTDSEVTNIAHRLNNIKNHGPE
ncbi:nuclease-related domain-containing protein [Winogradskyella forsetii]|uniref:nuclease-related domain-containing protein n=1 Tax=Winogradskyella forsetii TaxID=2686077 RepID=UPI0015BBC864|nr:nuclease-related domain-containing protein [Winogradskyella forsetii]